MINILEILKTIDTSKMERNYADFHAMCESEFEIYEYLQQDEVRLTYCWYHTWMCTDTYVGIRVWYLDNKPVCISYKPYRKYDENFYWLSSEDFDETHRYAMSLREDGDMKYSLVQDIETDFTESAKGIEYKQFESFNLKKA
jgi:hypothetical protein